MPRNRQHTEARIRAAALGLLQREGFSAWGVNAVARAAGVDKVLLYRYFTSMDGLLEEIIALTPFWPDPDTLPAHSGEAFLAATLEALEQQPQSFILLAHPAARLPASSIRRKFATDLGRWQEGLRAHVNGHPSPGRLERVAALLHCQAATGLHGFTPADLWAELAPALSWGASTAAVQPPPEAPERPTGELPTALL